MERRPLIGITLLYILGVLLGALPIPLLPLFVVAFVLLILFAAWHEPRRVLIWALVLLTGWINLAQRTAVLAPDDLRTSLGNKQVAVTLRGVLRETPSRRVHERHGQDVWSTTAKIEAEAIQIKNGDWRPVSGRVMAMMSGYLPEDYFDGRTVVVQGTLEPAEVPLAEGLFDYRKYLNDQGIYYELRNTKIGDWKLTSANATPPLADRFCAWARKNLAIGLPVEDETLRLEWALTLGWKAALTDEISEPFVHAATYHIFAVDGLRIAIVSGILLAFFKVVGVPRGYRGLLAVPVIWGYAAMTGWPASAIRAIVMIMVVFGGWLLNRPGNLINSLFAAALIILVWEPRQLFQAGFLLSFFVVLCIIMIRPFFDWIEKWLLKTDPFLPDKLLPRWRKALHTPAKWLADLSLSSVAAWLGSIPLVALYFHLVTPSSGPANVLAVPLCCLVLISNLCSLFLGAWFPYAAELFNHAGWFLMKCIQVTSQWSANWTGAYFFLPMPELFTIALYYIILLTTLTGWLFHGRGRGWKIGGVVLLIMIWCALWYRNLPIARLTILPLGSGYSAYLQSQSHGDDWLIDCGNTSMVATDVKPYLEAQGVNRLANLVVTHGEIAYSGGADLIYKLFHPRNIFVSRARFLSQDYREFLQKIKNDPASRKPVQSSDHIGPWNVLYPDEKPRFAKGEDNALVLRGDFYNVRVLLLSDLGHTGQNALLARTNDLRADIVVTGLPEENEPISDALLNAVKPSVIIVTDAPLKRAGEKLKRRLLKRHIPIFYTSETKAVKLTVRPGGWELAAMDGTRISSEDRW